MTPYSFLLLRTPLQSLNKAFNPVQISGVFEEAIFISSRDLWESVENSTEICNGKIAESLFKYWLRSCSRCTPFGIWAGTAVIDLSDKTSIVLNPDSNHLRGIRLDMNFISSIVSKLEKYPKIRSQLKFYVNNSLYESSSDFRYVEYEIDNDKRAYRLTSIEKTDYLVNILNNAKNGITITELADELSKLKDVSIEDAETFINELCRSQILISNLELCVTGKQPLTQILTNLQGFNDIDDITEIFKKINKAFEGANNGVPYYQSIMNTLKAFENETKNFKNIFQVDLFPSLKKSTISKEIIDEVASQCGDLLCFSFLSPNMTLMKFKENFKRKFEDSEIPLSVALDSDMGIGYGTVTETSSGGSDWIDDFLTTTSSTIHSENTSNVIYNFILKKYHSFLEKGLTEIEIDDKDIVALKDRIKNCFFSNGFYLHGNIRMEHRKFDKSNFQFELNYLGGPSGANLLSRFTHGDQRLCDLTRELLKEEENESPNVIFAEIVHLPEARVGNVLLRPLIRTYELPYVGRSGLNEDSQIPVSDLLVSIQQDEVVIRSKKFNKRIIPRLTTAHNYRQKSLPLYTFLCDIQNQGLTRPVLWDWANLANYKYLPRVRYKNILLKKAQWTLTKSDIKDLPPDKAMYLSFFEVLTTKFDLPQLLLYVEGDNKLLINLSNSDSLLLLIKLINKNHTIRLEEFIFSPENCIVRDKIGDVYTNEIVIPVKNDFQVKKYSEEINALIPPEKHLPNDTWIYYKLYAGFKTQEKILVNFLQPFLKKIISENLVEKFFFVRFIDERPHLRIRFHNSEPKKLHDIQICIQELVGKLYKDGYIDSAIIDTYSQEIIRYHPQLIEQAEYLFLYDSISTLNFLTMLDDIDSEFYRIVFSMRSIDSYLDDFSYDLTDKQALVYLMAERYLKEFGGSRELKAQLNLKYKSNKKTITSHMNPENDVENGIEEAIQLLQNRAASGRHIVNQIINIIGHDPDKKMLTELMSSYIHMAINRIFIAKQRRYELLIYFFLERHYYSLQAQMLQKKEQPKPSSGHVL